MLLAGMTDVSSTWIQLAYAGVVSYPNAAMTFVLKSWVSLMRYFLWSRCSLNVPLASKYSDLRPEKRLLNSFTASESYPDRAMTLLMKSSV